MYLANQDSRPQVNNQQPQPTVVGPNHQTSQEREPKMKEMKAISIKTLTTILIALTGILVILVVAALLFYKNYSESSYVDTSTYQSVDVRVSASTGDQVYFGQIKSLNSNYLILNDVFYLQPGTTSNQFNLNSLTCTLSGPQNQIIINRSQVVLWENLSRKSQVVTDIAKWHTDNIQCSKPSTTASSTTTTPSATSSQTSSLPTTPTSSATSTVTTVKKP
jgi:hypothetical protein